MQGRITLSLALLVVVVSGCQSFDIKKPFENFNKPYIKKSKYGRPASMVVMWTPDILTVVGKPPVRGFGGRIYFYNAKRKAIPVEGQLIIAGSDDSEVEETKIAKKIPDKRFAYSPEQFARYFQKTDIGASYSIWVPWEEIGGEMKSITLIPMFTSVEGHRVAGRQTKNSLPGRKRQSKKREEVLPAGHQTTLSDNPQRRDAGQLKTSTYSLPNFTARRLHNRPQPVEGSTITRSTQPTSSANVVPPHLANGNQPDPRLNRNQFQRQAVPGAGLKIPSQAEIVATRRNLLLSRGGRQTLLQTRGFAGGQRGAQRIQNSPVARTQYQSQSSWRSGQQGLQTQQNNGRQYQNRLPLNNNPQFNQNQNQTSSNFRRFGSQTSRLRNLRKELRASRFGPNQSLVPGAPIGRLDSSRDPRQRSPAIQPSVQPYSQQQHLTR